MFFDKKTLAFIFRVLKTKKFEIFYETHLGQTPRCYWEHLGEQTLWELLGGRGGGDPIGTHWELSGGIP
jgi:hypothetical protein